MGSLTAILRRLSSQGVHGYRRLVLELVDHVLVAPHRRRRRTPEDLYTTCESTCWASRSFADAWRSVWNDTLRTPARAQAPCRCPPRPEAAGALHFAIDPDAPAVVKFALQRTIDDLAAHAIVVADRDVRPRPPATRAEPLRSGGTTGTYAIDDGRPVRLITTADLDRLFEQASERRHRRLTPSVLIERMLRDRDGAVHRQFGSQFVAMVRCSRGPVESSLRIWSCNLGAPYTRRGRPRMP